MPLLSKYVFPKYNGIHLHNRRAVIKLKKCNVNKVVSPNLQTLFKFRQFLQHIFLLLFSVINSLHVTARSLQSPLMCRFFMPPWLSPVHLSLFLCFIHLPLTSSKLARTALAQTCFTRPPKLISPGTSPVTPHEKTSFLY